MAKSIDFTALLDRTMEEVTSPQVAIDLMGEEISDYARGQMLGKVQMLQHLMRECAVLEAAENAKTAKAKTEQTKPVRGTGNRVKHGK